jgi:hypothetical protein
VTAQAAHTEPSEWNARMRLIEERGAALRKLFGKRKFETEG